jgi:hypothetical protein
MIGSRIVDSTGALVDHDGVTGEGTANAPHSSGHNASENRFLPEGFFVDAPLTLSRRIQ